MSHSLGGLLDLPHGECNSILLEHIIHLNFEETPLRFKDIAKNLNIAADNLSDAALRDAICNRIATMRQNVGIPATITVETLADTTLDYLVENALSDPCMVTNPKVLTKDEVKNIYGRILESKE
jgi:alcohol dehydrogenase class IV